MEFYEKAQELVKGFDVFQNQYANPEEEKDEFSIASQHYDFLPPTITAFSERYPDYKNFRIFESTTVQILDEVAQGHSEIGIIYLNNQNQKGIMQRIEKLGLEVIELIPFIPISICVKVIPWRKKKNWSWRIWLIYQQFALLRKRTSTFTIQKTLSIPVLAPRCSM